MGYISSFNLYNKFIVNDNYIHLKGSFGTGRIEKKFLFKLINPGIEKNHIINYIDDVQDKKHAEIFSHS